MGAPLEVQAAVSQRFGFFVKKITVCAAYVLFGYKGCLLMFQDQRLPNKAVGVFASN